MNKSIIAAAASLSLLFVACDEKTEAPAKDEAADAKPAEKKADKKAEAGTEKKKDLHDAFTDLSTAEVNKLVDEKGCVPVDANGDSTREKYGIVPGALLLSGSDFKASELPEDKSKKLVFYCGGQACMAAPKAAKLAQDAGYKDVNVMRAGIRGWVKDGQKVEKPKS